STSSTFSRQSAPGFFRQRPRWRAFLAALALDRKKLAAFSALGGGFLRFPIGDRRCNRTRASVGNAGGDAPPSLTTARRPLSRSTDALACAVARVPTEDIISSAYASMRRESSRGTLAVAIQRNGCDVAQARMSELERDMQPLAEEILAAAA